MPLKSVQKTTIFQLYGFYRLKWNSLLKSTLSFFKGDIKIFKGRYYLYMYIYLVCRSIVPYLFHVVPCSKFAMYCVQMHSTFQGHNIGGGGTAPPNKILGGGGQLPPLPPLFLLFENDKLVLYYTGLSTWELLKKLLVYVEPHLMTKSSLSSFQQLLLTLVPL